MSNLFGDEDDAWDDDAIDADNSTPQSAAPVIVEPVGYAAIEAQLVEAINLNRLPHALIFAGDEGRGKELMAYRLARALLSTRKEMPFSDLSVSPTDPVMARLDNEAHPDFKLVKRVNKENKNELAAEIVIKSVRDATHFMNFKPVEGRYRVLIVDEAHLMNEETQNAFLKSLEEPPPHTLLVLIAHQPARLLATIRSRAHVVTFNALPETILLEQGGAELKSLSHDTQNIILRLCRGGVGAMKRLLTTPYVEAIEKIGPLLSPRSSVKDVYGFSESWGTTTLEGREPMDFLEDIILDHLNYQLRQNLNQEPVKDGLLDAIVQVKTLFSNARTRYLDKRQVIRQAFAYVKNA